MITHALTPAALSSLVAAHYDLVGPVQCDWHSSGLNAVFRVRTGREPYILKVYRAGWRTQTEVREEITALFHLHTQGLRVALPVAGRDGTFVWTLALPDQQRQVVLFAYAAGDAIPESDASCYPLLGRALANLHNASEDFTAAPVRFDLDNLLVSPLQELNAYLQDRPEEREFLQSLNRRLRTWVEWLPANTLDWGYCHGDFRQANLHLDRESGETTVFDLELGGNGFRAYDLAYLYTYLHPMALETLWQCPLVENYEACWAGFLSGYTACRALHSANQEAIPRFVAMRAFEVMGYLLRTRRESKGGETWPPSEPGGLPGGTLFERALQFLRSWNETYFRDN